MATITVINRNGTELDFAAAVGLMDDDIRNMMADDLSIATEQEFLAAYESEHKIKYNEEWELSKLNPIW
jgi:hypothetical protein